MYEDIVPIRYMWLLALYHMNVVILQSYYVLLTLEYTIIMCVIGS